MGGQDEGEFILPFDKRSVVLLASLGVLSLASIAATAAFLITRLFH